MWKLKKKCLVEIYPYKTTLTESKTALYTFLKLLTYVGNDWHFLLYLPIQLSNYQSEKVLNMNLICPIIIWKFKQKISTDCVTYFPMPLGFRISLNFALKHQQTRSWSKMGQCLRANQTLEIAKIERVWNLKSKFYFFINWKKTMIK